MTIFIKSLKERDKQKAGNEKMWGWGMSVVNFLSPAWYFKTYLCSCLQWSIFIGKISFHIGIPFARWLSLNCSSLLGTPLSSLEYTKVSDKKAYEIEDKILPQEAYMRIILKEPSDKCKTVAAGGMSWLRACIEPGVARSAVGSQGEPLSGDLQRAEPRSLASHTRMAVVLWTWLCNGMSSVSQFSHLVVSDSLRPHEYQHARPPCPSPTPGVYSDSCPSSQWFHPAISSSVTPFSSCPQSLQASGSFPVNQLFAWGGQSIGVSASALVFPVNTQDWSPLGWTGWISLQSKELSRVFSNTTVQKHQFFDAQLSSQSNSHIHTWPLANHSLDQADLCWQSNVSSF